MEEEIWRDIEGFPNYQVSNLGNVKSLNYHQSGKEKLLKSGKYKDGYLYVSLSQDGKVKKIKVHRLVATAFIPNPKNKPCVDHINTIRDDNRVENLRWVTSKENSNNVITLKKFSKANSGKNHHFYGKHHTEETKRKISKAISGENHYLYGKHRSEETKKKLSESRKGKYTGENHPNAKAVRCIELNKVFPTVIQAAEELGVNRVSISACCRGRRKSTGGYHFEYA